MRILVSVLEEVDVSVRDVASASSSTSSNPSLSMATEPQTPNKRDGGVLIYCGDQLVPANPIGITHAICSRCGGTIKAAWG